MWWLITGLFCYWCFISYVIECKTCLKDKALPDYPINTYTCDENTTLTECCEQNNEFTCCQSQDTHTWVQQAILWGSLVGVVSLAIIAWLCFRKDTNMCETGKRCCEGCCCCGKYERQKEADLSNLSDVRPASTMSQQYLYNRSYESPPPYSAHEKQPYYPSKQYPEMNDNTTRPVSTTAIRYGQV